MIDDKFENEIDLLALAMSSGHYYDRSERAEVIRKWLETNIYPKINDIQIQARIDELTDTTDDYGNDVMLLCKSSEGKLIHKEDRLKELETKLYKGGEND